ncbi:MAG: alanine--tRNA ligase [Xanthomonadales bacterium]|nr:alanine--tRNA ligase [Xanthomonadales bacterium]
MKSTAEIRQAYLDYFADRGHKIVSSSSLVPGNDPTLLFTNAGMVQFKDLFLGSEKRDYKRATSSQRCVRAGGKHNDLENVGYTARHHTFFEMLGNFSFGDYFKKEAIEFAWDFLTNVLKLPAEKLWITVFEEDDEAAEIWIKHIGVDPDRVSRIGAKDNFWSMGDTGPCGPCTEIFYDHGPEVAGGPPGTPEEDGDRYIEIWNLVFMQFDRAADGSMANLPAPSVDTGMGLERLAAILQGVHSNYQIDLFQGLIAKAAELTGCDDLENDSLKVIADHIRACAFMIVDGVLPGNEGRSYVLRRIIRRAIRHGYKLGQKQPFFAAMVPVLVEQMGQAYPELTQKTERVQQALLKEEQRFAQTLEQGMRLLDGVLEDLAGSEIPGESVFKLYDTYGFPLDLTADIAREKGLTIDQAGFDTAMNQQRERARAAGQFSAGESISADVVKDLTATEFTGYNQNSTDEVTLLAILVGGKLQQNLNVGEKATLILNKTPFYAESGGQVGDSGQLQSTGVIFEVADTQKLAGVYHAHQGVLSSGSLQTGDHISAAVDSARRQAIRRHHSATHLLHAALRKLLGSHVEQKGSLVTANKLRFDFSHNSPVSAKELREIEILVNDKTLANIKAEVAEMSYEDALKAGALALFGEKYGDKVRVLSFDDYSVELCGGTHVQRTGDIGLIKVTSETGIASGIRRIEAVVGEQAVQWVQQQSQRDIAVASLLKSGLEDVPAKVKHLLERLKLAEKENSRLESKLASSSGQSLSDKMYEVNGVNVLAEQLPTGDMKIIRETMDDLKSRLENAVILLAGVDGGKVRLVAGVSKNITGTYKAGSLVNHIAVQVGGRGGGRPDMAQAGGTDATQLAEALKSVKQWVKDQKQ